jgi:lysophospholipase L1-like esterase
VISAFLLIFFVITIIFVVAFLYVSSIIATLPKGRAINFTEKDNSETGRVIACIGDSLTHGNIGDCWVERLRQEFPKDIILNEGINGDVVWQVHQRIDPILKCKPDIAIIMIGSNDAMASFNKNSGERYKRNNSLPEVPTFENYQKLLSELIGHLSAIPKIALCTLPPIGEHQDSSINQHINKFNDCIKLTAQEKNTSLLPVSDSLWDELDKRLYPLRSDYDPNTLPILRRIYGGVIHHYVFKKSWDKVAESKGQWLLFDQIHLGERAAKIIFNLTKNYISSSQS